MIVISLISQSSQKNGFTLVEMAIVMIVIGLLIGGILKGQELITNSQMAALINQEQKITAAYNTFRDSYKGVPGDMVNATSTLPNCSAATACVNGDGNDVVGSVITGSSIPNDINAENTQFWKHLALADLIGGVNGSATTVAWGQTHPETKITKGGIFVQTGNTRPLTPIMVCRANISGVAGYGNSSNAGTNLSISPTYAQRIDKKIDDGIALTGNVQSISASLQTGCGAGNAGTNGPDGYDHSSGTNTCEITFKIN